VETGVVNPTSARYMSALFLKRVLLIALGFAFMLTLFDVLNNSDQIERRYGGEFATIFRYMGWRFPEMVATGLPFSILLAALLTLLGMAQSNEVLALKAAGMSFWRMLMLLAPAAALVAVAHFAIADQAVPWAKRRLALMELDKPIDDAAGRARSKEKAVWLRDSHWLVQVQGVQRDGRLLTDVVLLRRDAEGNLVERVSAKRARWERGAWVLDSVTVYAVEAQAVAEAKVDRQPWRTPLRPVDFYNQASGSGQFSARQLLGLANGEMLGARPAYVFDTWLQRRFTLPAVAFMMLLLAAPVAQARVRMANLGARLAAGVCLGFLYFVADGVALALGESGAVLPLVSAWAPVVIFASVGGSVLLRIEGV
jgi:lipopolysaccharide export system permease protein